MPTKTTRSPEARTSGTGFAAIPEKVGGRPPGRRGYAPGPGLPGAGRGEGSRAPDQTGGGSPSGSEVTLSPAGRDFPWGGRGNGRRRFGRRHKGTLVQPGGPQAEEQLHALSGPGQGQPGQLLDAAQPVGDGVGMDPQALGCGGGASAFLGPHVKGLEK